MAQNNVFQMLAQQELDRPQRRLSELQTKMAELQMQKAIEGQAYQDKFNAAMAGGGTGTQGQPDPTSFTRSMGGQWTQNGQPVSDAALPISPSVAGLSLSNMGAPAPAPQAQQAFNLKKRMDDEIQFHLANNRRDKAIEVFNQQLEVLTKVDSTLKAAYSRGGQPAVDSFLQDNPHYAAFTGQPQFQDGNVIYRYQNPDGTPSDTKGYRIEGGKHVDIDIAPKVDQEALIDKRFANQQKLQSEQIAAQDRRTAQQIAAADRRASSGGHGGKDKPPFGYRFLANGDLEAIPGGPASPDGKQGGKILPAGQLESIADMKRVKDVLAEASDLLKGGGIDTGPVSGRLQSLGAKVGLASDNFVNLQQKMQTAENIMLKLRSGAAVTESEYQRFKKEFPRTSDSPEVRDRKMSNAIQYASTLMDSKMDIYEEGGYRVPQSVKSGNKPVQKANSQPKQGQTKKGGRFTIIEVK